MRTFHVNAPIIIGAGCLAFCVLAPAPSISLAETPVAPIAAPGLPISVPAKPALRQDPPTLAELRSRLDRSDRSLALKALVIAMRRLGDGETMVWRRPSRQLMGEIKPISAFRDAKGRICRRLIYMLSLGTYRKQIKGTACREKNGNWVLSG